jgi:hypothetical protein
MSTYTLEQAILWRRIDSPGHDACALWADENGFRLIGGAAFNADGQPCQLSYEVLCDTAWLTKSASVIGWIGRNPVKLSLESVSGSRWVLNGDDQGEEVAELVDLDLGFTPATNLIQLRRFSLGIGDTATAPVAYLQFPELSMRRLEHRYERVALDKYDYHAPDFGYSATLLVSNLGFITQYPGLWELETILG